MSVSSGKTRSNKRIKWRVDVYHATGGPRKFAPVVMASKAHFAIKRAKEWMYSQRHLPHMYTYVPVRIDESASEYTKQSRGG